MLTGWWSLLLHTPPTAYPQAVYKWRKSTAEVALGLVVLVFFPPAVPFCSFELGFGFGFFPALLPLFPPNQVWLHLRLLWNLRQVFTRGAIYPMTRLSLVRWEYLGIDTNLL